MQGPSQARQGAGAGAQRGERGAWWPAPIEEGGTWGLSEVCLRGAGLVGEAFWGAKEWERSWKDLQWARAGAGVLLHRVGGGLCRNPLGVGGGGYLSQEWEVLCLPPSPTAERGVKAGNHRGERKDKNVVESLGYPGGALEAAAEGEHCSWSPVAVGLANCPLDMVGTLRGIRRMAGNPCGSRGGDLGVGQGGWGGREPRGEPWCRGQASAEPTGDDQQLPNAIHFLTPKWTSCFLPPELLLLSLYLKAFSYSSQLISRADSSRKPSLCSSKVLGCVFPAAEKGGRGSP